MSRFRFLGVAAAAAATFACAGAAAATTVQDAAVSGNWAGYTVQSSNGTGFSNVAATWVEPTVVGEPLIVSPSISPSLALRPCA